jgi:glycine cleavage system aminomethyltransferase T
LNFDFKSLINDYANVLDEVTAGRTLAELFDFSLMFSIRISGIATRNFIGKITDQKY